MALNWAMIASDGQNPVPLPGEKVLFRQEKTTLNLDLGGEYPGNPNNNYKAEGITFITNQRIIFISRPTLPHFKSLSIPLLNLKEGKLQQPWFGANYYQAIVIPVLNGGLPSPGQLKITFKEGGGFEFSTYYNEMISRLSETEGTIPIEHAEPLPTYTPRENAENSSSHSTAASTTVAAASTLVSSSSPPPPQPQPQMALTETSISTPEISNINNNELLPSPTTPSSGNVNSSIVTSPQLIDPDELPPSYDEVINR
ncbi:hypothetical protein Glove_384g63 [Diversispora epigaea]|uniref:GRAM domain-containing protein n=1 Tax=Diversispora epigaea TaxID=1348612 RepID=A0A397HBE0_9GLOM|nr:hypothetical protein Glove_384g63 [Diversispora epigaea]